MKTKIRASILAILISLAGGCGHGGKSPPTPSPAQQVATTVQPKADSTAEVRSLSTSKASPRAAGSIKIATFNIRDFGRTKASKPAVMKILAEIVRKYDVVAVQEVSDSTSTAVNALRDTVTAQGGHYDYEVSERSGSTASESAKEQYAFFYNTTTLEPSGTGRLFDDQHDQFKREPYVARFKVKQGNFTFVLISIHTEPKTTVAEIDALDDVFMWAAKQFPGEDDFIALGDFNAGCSYATTAKLDGTRLRRSGYTWVVPDDADTNLAPKACAYDRMVFRDGTKTDYAGSWGVDKSFEDGAVSDHWPVWAEFYADRDN
jgi:endonuclease/exonuclease/phosphatase family metal-dependent hydrolase